MPDWLITMLAWAIAFWLPLVTLLINLALCVILERRRRAMLRDATKIAAWATELQGASVELKGVREEAERLSKVMRAEYREVVEAKIGCDQAAYQIWGVSDSPLQPAEFIDKAGPILFGLHRASARKAHLRLAGELERVVRDSGFSIDGAPDRLPRQVAKQVIEDLGRHFAMSLVQSVREPEEDEQ